MYPQIHLLISHEYLVKQVLELFCCLLPYQFGNNWVEWASSFRFSTASSWPFCSLLTFQSISSRTWFTFRSKHLPIKAKRIFKTSLIGPNFVIRKVLSTKDGEKKSQLTSRKRVNSVENCGTHDYALTHSQSCKISDSKHTAMQKHTASRALLQELFTFRSWACIIYTPGRALFQLKLWFCMAILTYTADHEKLLLQFFQLWPLVSTLEPLPLQDVAFKITASAWRSCS